MSHCYIACYPLNLMFGFFLSSSYYFYYDTTRKYTLGHKLSLYYIRFFVQHCCLRGYRTWLFSYYIIVSIILLYNCFLLLNLRLHSSCTYISGQDQLFSCFFFKIFRHSVKTYLVVIISNITFTLVFLHILREPKF